MVKAIREAQEFIEPAASHAHHDCLMHLNRCATPVRLLWVLPLVIIAAVIAVAAPGTGTSALSPNIILIMSDDLGYGDLGCYGQKRIKTPHLDRMASEGMRFTSFYAGSTVCTPSRAALMLGQHTGHLNLRGNVRGGTLLPKEKTVAEVLKAAGYNTGLIGKWGLADEGLPGVPQKKGFDQFLGYLENRHAHDYYPGFVWRYDSGNELDGVLESKVLLPENEAGKEGNYFPDTCTKSALNFVRIYKPDRFNRRKPFFLFLSYTTPHANNEEGNRTGNGMQVPSDEPYSNEDWPQPEKNKAAMITRMDADIGRLLDYVRSNQVENTLVLFTSDNGPHKEGGVDPEFHNSAGPLRGYKRTLTEGGIRVPLIAWWPGTIKAGQVTDFVAANWDLMPTFAEIAGIKPPAGLDGFSILPLLKNGKQERQHEYLYWEFHERGFQQALRMGSWKAIRTGAGKRLELYDLTTDLGETNNVAAQHPDVIAKIEEELKAARTDSDRWPVKPAPAAKGS